jgi:SpoVK/Ycf46/Vps4 family AAA+-type ATPase
MDETLLRAGRFDLKIYVAKPDDEEREEIFAELMGKYIEAAPRRTVFDLTQIGLAALVAETEGMAHVDIVTILRKLVAGRAVAEIRARSIPSAITENDILEMIRKHRQG